MAYIKRHASNIRAFVVPVLIFWIPFGTRKFILHFTQGFDEYESVFIYLSDFLILISAGLFLAHMRWKTFFRSPNILWIFLVIAAASIVWAHHYFLALYAFARLVLVVLFFFVMARYCEEPRPRFDLSPGGERPRDVDTASSGRKFDRIMMILAASSVIQALIGMAQFFSQQSVGLRFLGESQLGAGAKGVAKIATEYGRFIRAYGTMPHANIYAALLIIGLLALYYLWVRHARNISARKKITATALLSASIFIVLTGLVLSFSRSGWISAILATLVFFGFFVFSSLERRAQGISLAAVVALSVFALYHLFSFAIRPRIEMSTVADYSISSRLTYNELALRVIGREPLGVGIGNQVLYSVETGLYGEAGMTRLWEWQPIHNIYLLMASEVGILGLIAFLIFIIHVMIPGKNQGDQNPKHRWRLRAINLFQGLSASRSAALAMLVALLAFGLFDHFLWDLQPGRLLLWLILALVYTTAREDDVPVV